MGSNSGGAWLFSSFENIPILLLLLLSQSLFVILLFLERAMALFYIRVGVEVFGVSEMETLYQAPLAHFDDLPRRQAQICFPFNTQFLHTSRQ
jgi:hypothetical protein